MLVASERQCGGCLDMEGSEDYWGMGSALGKRLEAALRFCGKWGHPRDSRGT